MSLLSASLILTLFASARETGSISAARETVAEGHRAFKSQDFNHPGLRERLERAELETDDPELRAQIALLQAVYWENQGDYRRAIDFLVDAVSWKPDVALDPEYQKAQTLVPQLECVRKHVVALSAWSGSSISGEMRVMRPDVTPLRKALGSRPYKCPEFVPPPADARRSTSMIAASTPVQTSTKTHPASSSPQRPSDRPLEAGLELRTPPAQSEVSIFVSGEYWYARRPLDLSPVHFWGPAVGVEWRPHDIFVISARANFGVSKNAEDRFILGVSGVFYWHPWRFVGVGLDMGFAAANDGLDTVLSGGWTGFGPALRLMPFVDGAAWISGLNVEAAVAWGVVFTRAQPRSDGAIGSPGSAPIETGNAHVALEPVVVCRLTYPIYSF